MTGPTFDIVCTTIGDGSFLKHYAKALDGAQDRARVIVIPDRKTPAALWEAVKDARAQGFRVECPDLNEQAAFLESLGAPAGMFPFDTDHRRNIGYLMAWRDGADIMVSVDDDNLPLDGWLAEHEIVTQKAAQHGLRSDPFGHFFNPFELLDVTPEVARPRGYTYRQPARFGPARRSVGIRDIAINAGLWLGDPDVDAIMRVAVGAHSHALRGSAVLAADTWAPVNSQNTAIRRDVIPAYYFFRSGRFGDIYQGYLAQACAKAMGHSVRFGTPAVTHARNDHDLLRDLQLELPDILILDRWLDWLTGVGMAGGTYAGNYEWLAGLLHEHARSHEYTMVQRTGLHEMALQMTDWLTLIRKIGA